MKHLLLRALLALLALGALAGCGWAPATATQRQTVDGLTVAIELPQEVELLQSYDLTVTLTDSSGAPVEGARVYLDLTMPAMPMGQNQPLAEPAGGGRYRAQAIFNMLGEWAVRVNVAAGGKSYAANFSLTVKAAGS